MRQSIIIVGPRGCGKSTNAKRFQKCFNLEIIKDDGVQQIPKGRLEPRGVLYLVQELPKPANRSGILTITFNDAMGLSEDFNND